MAIRDNLKAGGSSKKLYEALQYSGLVTEDMTFDEMLAVLAETYPEIYVLYKNGVNGGAFEAYAGTILEKFAFGEIVIAPTIAFSENMTITLNSNNNSTVGCAITKSIDLTRLKTLSFSHESFCGAGSLDYKWVKLFITPSKKSNMTATISRDLMLKQTSSNGNVTIDISTLNGEYYIGFEMRSHGTDATKTIIKNMFME